MSAAVLPKRGREDYHPQYEMGITPGYFPIRNIAF